MSTENDLYLCVGNAGEYMMSYVGYLNAEVLKEEDQQKPNQTKIRALEQQLKAVLDERHRPLTSHPELVAKAHYIYALIMKTLYGKQLDVPQGDSWQGRMDDDVPQFEVATETMAAYFRYLSIQVMNEEKQKKPNQAKLMALKEQIDVLLDERESLVDREELIAKAIYVYGPIMQALYAS